MPVHGVGEWKFSFGPINVWDICVCGNNKLGRRYDFKFKWLLKRAIPSSQLHPLRTSYFILSSTIPSIPSPISSPLDTIPFYLLVSPLPLSLSLPLNVYLPISSPPPSNSYCSFSCPLPIPSYQLHPTLLPPISNPTDTDPSALLISPPIPLSNPTDTNSLSFSPSFSSLISFHFSCRRISP